MEQKHQSVMSIADSAWQRFEKSGTISDYLSYRHEVESGRLIDDVVKNPGSCPEAPNYR